MAKELGMADAIMRRAAVRLLEGIGNGLWGFPPNLMVHVVDRLGPVRAIGWFVANMPRYERTLKVLGPIRTHLAAMTISLHNGCRYCSYGHAYALELVYLAEHDRIFPVSAEALIGWRGVPPAQLRERLRSALERAELHLEVLWMDKTLALVEGARPLDGAEARIEHLVRMFAVLNAVGMAYDTEPDEAHDPLNKDHLLKARNADLRASVG